MLDAREPWLREKLTTVMQSSPIVDAIRYALKHWQGLCRFLDDGRVEIDSNTVKRAIRPQALTRKNILFAGSDGGGAHWAIATSLIESKLNAINPHDYLTDTLPVGGDDLDLIGALALAIDIERRALGGLGPGRPAAAIED